MTSLLLSTAASMFRSRRAPVLENLARGIDCTSCIALEGDVDSDSPSSLWAARQPIEALPRDTAPIHLFRDRDKIFGLEFERTVSSLGIEEIRI